ncbi:hypothetical protein [Cytobacillus horneckiae]|uniref:Uncharacterized protein n=1 Tax=Cytobacillus horneckiae TaxID=549687 RepID=A0A2N0ZBG1_9BACI|nr:hypothetical protein [Cytobacillus horneckiae]MEC1158533.1 hypothetical protein [Cytobacillus horneckiae]MED2939636.1 hypothetical protein [Cytobacillus horneckiae]PKG26814.1 hypothetical protein CWS20_22245 [Cytobacillus horneckiae]
MGESNYQDDTFASFSSYGTIGFYAKWIQSDCSKEAEDVAISLKNMAVNYNWLPIKDKPVLQAQRLNKKKTFDPKLDKRFYVLYLSFV